MTIISKAVIKEFTEKYPAAEKALVAWYETAKVADWQNLHDIKRDFRITDALDNDLYVFKVKANELRLVTKIIFKSGTICILFLGTHEEYHELQ